MASKTPTPVRDQMGINRPDALDALEGSKNLDAATAVALGKARSERRRMKHGPSKLARGLAALPKASNEFGLVMPSLPPPVDEKKILGLEQSMEEDAEDALHRLEQEAAAKEQASLRRRSATVQRALPRPLSLNSAMVDLADGAEEAGQEAVGAAVRKEMFRLLRHDSVAHPAAKEKSRKRKRATNAPSLLKLTDEEMGNVRVPPLSLLFRTFPCALLLLGLFHLLFWSASFHLLDACRPCRLEKWCLKKPMLFSRTDLCPCWVPYLPTSGGSFFLKSLLWLLLISLCCFVFVPPKYQAI